MFGYHFVLQISVLYRVSEMRENRKTFPYWKLIQMSQILSKSFLNSSLFCVVGVFLFLILLCRFQSLWFFSMLFNIVQNHYCASTFLNHLQISQCNKSLGISLHKKKKCNIFIISLVYPVFHGSWGCETAWGKPKSLTKIFTSSMHTEQ